MAAITCAASSSTRGGITRVTVSRPGTGGALTFTGAYDAAGALVRQDLPGGIVATSQRNLLGQETGMTYAGQVTPVTATTDPETGETTWTPGAPTTAPWVAWSVDRDGLGRVAREFTSTGAAFDPDPAATAPEPGGTGTSEVGTAVPYDRAYGYDAAGRLVRVNDRIGHGQGAPSGLGPEVPATPAAPCYVRTYSFDGAAGLNGARTGESFAISTDGDCTNPAPAYKATATYTYDAADRPVTGKAIEGAPAPGAYVYDAFGRQTKVPASDAPNRDAGDITIGYFDTDLARTITQGASSTELTLDSADRRATQTVTDATSVTKTVVRSYTDDSDNPSWVEETKPGQGTTTTRFVEGVSAELGAMITDTGEATISLSNPHGDNVSSVIIPADQASDVPCTAMGGWADYTEFGQPYGFTPVNNPAVVGPIGYGWLGTQQRSNTGETAGLTLMGVRLYNPATGAFTTPDPVYGGNDTSYTYPQDPINSDDVGGDRCRCDGPLNFRLSEGYRYTTSGKGRGAVNTSGGAIRNRGRPLLGRATIRRKRPNRPLAIGILSRSRGDWNQYHKHMVKYQQYKRNPLSMDNKRHLAAAIRAGNEARARTIYVTRLQSLRNQTNLHRSNAMRKYRWYL